MDDFLTIGWPYWGIGAAAVLLVLLFTTDRFRSDTRIPRFYDLAWLAWLPVAAYAIHQFEEHGIDLLGDAYPFRGSLCQMLGYAQAATCPVPVSFITAVNIPLVWLSLPLSALLGRRRPLVALSAFSVPAVNAVAHIVPGILRLGYNPGLATAIVMFVPLSIWAVRVARTRYKISTRQLAVVIASGVIVHAVLGGALLLFLHGVLNEVVLDTVESLDMFVPLAVALSLGEQK